MRSKFEGQCIHVTKPRVLKPPMTGILILNRVWAFRTTKSQHEANFDKLCCKFWILKRKECPIKPDKVQRFHIWVQWNTIEQGLTQELFSAHYQFQHTIGKIYDRIARDYLCWLLWTFPEDKLKLSPQKHSHSHQNACLWIFQTSTSYRSSLSLHSQKPLEED